MTRKSCSKIYAGRAHPFADEQLLLLPNLFRVMQSRRNDKFSRHASFILNFSNNRALLYTQKKKCTSQQTTTETHTCSKIYKFIYSKVTILFFSGNYVYIVLVYREKNISSPVVNNLFQPFTNMSLPYLYVNSGMEKNCIFFSKETTQRKMPQKRYGGTNQ